jgi:Tol biopolymer transport system component
MRKDRNRIDSMRITFLRLMLILTGLILIAGCRGTMQVGIEQTPTPDRSITATLDALRAENDRLATRVAEQVAALATSLELGQLAFVQGGDIWTLPLFDESANPQRLTVDGYNREPRWSPSGKWLAYRKERQSTLVVAPASVQGSDLTTTRRQVWVIQASGNGEHPLNQGLSVEQFAWSPKGDRLAYTTSGVGMQVINADGTNLIPLLAEDPSAPIGENHVGQIFWSPDGKWIAYERRTQPTSRPPVYQGLWMVSAEGGEPIELYAAGLPEKSEAILLGWSTLGDAIFFVQDPLSSEPPVDGGRLYMVRATVPLSPTAAARLIEHDAVLPYTDFVAPNPLNAAWQDRESVAYVVGAGHSTWTNKRIKAAGRFITGEDLAAISPVWASAGDRLAFAAMPDRGELAPGDVTALMPRRLWIAQAEGESKLRALTNSNSYRDERPLWSADGDYLLFARLDAKGRASLWIIPASGGVPRQVVAELTPAPDPYEMFGHVNWGAYYDWWRGP